MSSLAAVQADGFYIDPHKYNPAKGKGSANAISGTHPLGARASKLKSDGILVIRFEMPYDSVCLKCGHFISHGVRFNADKRRTGTYLSTPLYSFTMMCPVACGQRIVIETDPENASYKYLEGLRRKIKDFVPDAADGLGRSGGSLFLSQEVKKSREEASRDGMIRLQRSVDDKARADMNAAELEGMAWTASVRRSVGVQRDAWALLTKAREQQRSLEAQGEARGLQGPLVSLTPHETAEDLFIALSALQQQQQEKRITEEGASGRGESSVPASLKATLLSQPITLVSAAPSPPVPASTISTSRVPSVALVRASESTSTAIGHPSRRQKSGVESSTAHLPASVVAIVEAGRKRKAESEEASRFASRESASRIQGYFHALSGKTPSVTLRSVGPTAPPQHKKWAQML